MEYLVSASEMKACDRSVIERYGVPSLVLMERAALGCVELLQKEEFDLTRVLVLAGSGNNGGDGFAMARIMHLQGISADVWFVGDPDHMTEEAALQKKICENYGVNFVRNFSRGEYTTIVDALFGSGLSREISGPAREAVEAVNSEKKAKVFSVDIPSGVMSDSGKISGAAVKAHVTGALAFRKIGHILYPGASCAGKIVRIDIGVTKEGFLDPKTGEGTFPAVRILKPEDFSALPKRQPDANKGTFGKAALIAGSRNMAGAAYLCGKGAYLMGTGLVQVVTDECNRSILQTLLPEAVLSTVETYPAETAASALSWAGAAGIGPGLSTEERAAELLRVVLEKREIPLVLDADALNLLAVHPDWLRAGKSPVILTPHMGEMARLTGRTVEEIRERRLETAREFALKKGVILVLKDARTLITDGKTMFLNETGNDGMAVGGSGDVLTGMITGLLAQGAEPLTAAALGVYLHGLAGDEARRRKGARGMLSTDLLETLPFVLKEGMKYDGE